jgi:hypothetical protein
MEVSYQFYATAPALEKDPWHPLHKRLSKTQSQWRREKSISLPEIEPQFPGHSARNLVTTLTELSCNCKEIVN